ncbi:MAG: DUF5711 family protein [Lachnospiraceae bacterium]|nr:DUF5711 family protein [Lachnospiraceae bacterium]
MEESRPFESRIAVVVIVLLLGAICAVIVYAAVNKGRIYSSWEVVSAADSIEDARYLKTDGGFIAYNHDGAEGHSHDGSLIWKISYHLGDPIADACGAYAVFADRGGQTVSLSDGSGANYSFNVSGEITEVRIASQGVTAIRTNEGISDQIFLYDINGNMLLEMRTDVKKAGFPITFDLSPDGTKLITSYLEVGQENKSWLTFYNFGDVGQNYADKIVGSYSYDANIIADVRFLGDNNAAVFYSGGCDLYKFREVPEKTGSLEYPGGISSICDRNGCFAISSKDADGAIRIDIYGTDGKSMAKIATSMSFDTMALESDELILTSGDSCVIYKTNGKEKFRARMDEYICMMISGSGKSEYLVAGKEKTERIRLRTLREDSKVKEEAVPDVKDEKE